jgi:hypothetical protein
MKKQEETTQNALWKEKEMIFVNRHKCNGKKKKSLA